MDVLAGVVLDRGEGEVGGGGYLFWPFGFLAGRGRALMVVGTMRKSWGDEC